MALAARYQEKLDEWLEMNREQWAQLQQHGATDGSELELDYSFSCADEPSAKAFAKEYEHRYAGKPTVEFLPQDGPDEPAAWAIFGTTPPTATTLASLDAWVEELIRLGAESGCLFEGWGTYPPGATKQLLSIGQFHQDDDETKARFPLLLHVRVPMSVEPIERGERYDEPLATMLEKKSLGRLIRAGSLCDAETYETVGFELVLRVADQELAARSVKQKLLESGAPDSLEVRPIDEDTLERG